MKTGRNVWIAAAVVVLVAGVGLAIALTGPKPKTPAPSGGTAALIGTETVISASEGTSAGEGAAATPGSTPASAAAGASGAGGQAETTATMQSTGATPDVQGKQFAFVRKAWKEGAQYYVSVDFAQLLTGDAAVKAAEARGLNAPDNGYYILNDDTTAKTYALDAKARVRYIQPGTTALVESSADAFVIHWAKHDVATLDSLPYYATVKGDAVDQLDQVYLP